MNIGITEMTTPTSTPSTQEVLPAIADFAAVRLLEVEIGAPLHSIGMGPAVNGLPYRHALALVRFHGQPLGVVALDLPEAGLEADALAACIWADLHTEIMAHARQDGLADSGALTAAGIPSTGLPRCQQARAALLDNAPMVSIVVATHDRTDSLVTCLDSLLALDYPNYDIIVVDNAPSSSETVDMLRQRYPQVRYVREDHPGLAHAHNCGLVEVTAPIVAFTDDDVVVDPHWLTEIVLGFNAGQHVGCVSGMIFPIELETPAQVWIEQYGGFSKGFVPRIFDRDANRPADALFPYTAGRFGSGANMAFKTEALRAIGGFDPALGAGSKALGGDDLSAFFEIIMAGYQLVYQPGAIIHHGHRREYAGLRRQAYGYGVGLTAYLTGALLRRPYLLLDMLIKMPRGLYYALSDRSPKNNKKQGDYPAELTWLERKGMLYGPLAYLRSRWHTHKKLGRATRPRKAETLRHSGAFSD